MKRRAVKSTPHFADTSFKVPTQTSSPTRGRHVRRVGPRKQGRKLPQLGRSKSPTKREPEDESPMQSVLNARQQQDEVQAVSQRISAVLDDYEKEQLTPTKDPNNAYGMRGKDEFPTPASPAEFRVAKLEMQEEVAGLLAQVESRTRNRMVALGAVQASLQSLGNPDAVTQQYLDSITGGRAGGGMLARRGGTQVARKLAGKTGTWDVDTHGFDEAMAVAEGGREKLTSNYDTVVALFKKNGIVGTQALRQLRDQLQALMRRLEEAEEVIRLRDRKIARMDDRNKALADETSQLTMRCNRMVRESTEAGVQREEAERGRILAEERLKKAQGELTNALQVAHLQEQEAARSKRRLMLAEQTSRELSEKLVLAKRRVKELESQLMFARGGTKQAASASASGPSMIDQLQALQDQVKGFDRRVKEAVEEALAEAKAKHDAEMRAALDKQAQKAIENASRLVAEQDELEERCQRLQRQLDKATSQVKEAEGERDRMEGRIQGLRAQLRDAEARAKEFEQQMHTRPRGVGSRVSDVKAESIAKEVVGGDSSSARLVEAVMLDLIAQAAQEEASVQARTAHLEAELARLNGLLADTNQENYAGAKSKKELATEVERMTQELSEALAANKAANDELDALKAQVFKLQQHLGGVVEARTEAAQQARLWQEKFAVLECGLDVYEDEAVQEANAKILQLKQELEAQKQLVEQARQQAKGEASRAAELAVSMRRIGLETPDSKSRREGKDRSLGFESVETVVAVPSAGDVFAPITGNGSPSQGRGLPQGLPPLALAPFSESSDEEDLTAGLAVNDASAAELFNDLCDVGCNTEDLRVSSGTQTRVTGDHLDKMQAKLDALQDDGTVTGALAKWSKAKLAEEYQKLRRIAWDIRNENARLLSANRQYKARLEELEPAYERLTKQTEANVVIAEALSGIKGARRAEVMRALASVRGSVEHRLHEVRSAAQLAVNRLQSELELERKASNMNRMRSKVRNVIHANRFMNMFSKGGGGGDGASPGGNAGGSFMALAAAAAQQSAQAQAQAQGQSLPGSPQVSQPGTPGSHAGMGAPRVSMMSTASSRTGSRGRTYPELDDQLADVTDARVETLRSSHSLFNPLSPGGLAHPPIRENEELVMDGGNDSAATMGDQPSRAATTPTLRHVASNATDQSAGSMHSLHSAHSVHSVHSGPGGLGEVPDPRPPSVHVAGSVGSHGTPRNGLPSARSVVSAASSHHSEQQVQPPVVTAIAPPPSAGSSAAGAGSPSVPDIPPRATPNTALRPVSTQVVPPPSRHESATGSGGNTDDGPAAAPTPAPPAAATAAVEDSSTTAAAAAPAPAPAPASVGPVVEFAGADAASIRPVPFHAPRPVNKDTHGQSMHRLVALGTSDAANSGGGGTAGTAGTAGGAGAGGGANGSGFGRALAAMQGGHATQAASPFGVAGVGGPGGAHPSLASNPSGGGGGGPEESQPPPPGMMYESGVRHEGDQAWLNVGMGEFDPWADLVHTREQLDRAGQENEHLHQALRSLRAQLREAAHENDSWRRTAKRLDAHAKELDRQNRMMDQLDQEHDFTEAVAMLSNSVNHLQRQLEQGHVDFSYMSKFAEDLKSRSVRSLSKIKQRLQRRRAGRVPMPGAPLPRSQSMQPKAADRASTNNGGGGGGLGVGGTPLGGRRGRRQKRSTSVRAVRSGHSANSRLTPVNEPGGASSRRSGRRRGSSRSTATSDDAHGAKRSVNGSPKRSVASPTPRSVASNAGGGAAPIQFDPIVTDPSAVAAGGRLGRSPSPGGHLNGTAQRARQSSSSPIHQNSVSSPPRISDAGGRGSGGSGGNGGGDTFLPMLSNSASFRSRRSGGVVGSLGTSKSEASLPGVAGRTRSGSHASAGSGGKGSRGKARSATHTQSQPRAYGIYDPAVGTDATTRRRRGVKQEAWQTEDRPASPTGMDATPRSAVGPWPSARSGRSPAGLAVSAGGLPVPDVAPSRLTAQELAQLGVS